MLQQANMQAASSERERHIPERIFTRVRLGPCLLPHDTAGPWTAEGRADLITFRRLIANPDLPQRFRAGGLLNAERPKICFGGTEECNTDHPTLEQIGGEASGPSVGGRWRWHCVDPPRADRHREEARC